MLWIDARRNPAISASTTWWTSNTTAEPATAPLPLGRKGDRFADLPRSGALLDERGDADLLGSGGDGTFFDCREKDDLRLRGQVVDLGGRFETVHPRHP